MATFQSLIALCAILRVAFDFDLAPTPGKHAPDKLAARRLRAINKGFLVAHQGGSSSHRRHVEVSSQVADRVKAVAKSLAIQDDHIRSKGSPQPIARLATLALKDQLSHAEFKAAMRAHDDSNAAKHRWKKSDLVTSWADTTEADEASPEDPVFLCDPWHGACYAQEPAVIPTTISFSAASRISAPEPQSGVCSSSPPMCGATLDYCSQISAMQRLIDTQNSTIALLSRELEALRSRPVDAAGSTLCAGLSAAKPAAATSSSEDTAQQPLPAHGLSEGSTLAVRAVCTQVILDQVRPLMTGTWEDTKELIKDTAAANTECTKNTLLGLATSLSDLCRKMCDKFKAKLEAVEEKLHQIEANLNTTQAATPPISSHSEVGADGDADAPASDALPDSADKSHDAGSLPNYGEAEAAHGAKGAPVFGNGSFVTLVGLNTEQLNGQSGTVIAFNSSSGRYAVELHPTRERKSIKGSNLISFHYDPRNPELCRCCSAPVNLNAFPVCDCEPRAA